MATVQHLEKLYYVKELFESTESLESAVACERINILIAQTEKLLYQRTFLRDERRRLRMATEQIEATEKGLKLTQRKDFIPESMSSTVQPSVLSTKIDPSVTESKNPAPSAIPSSAILAEDPHVFINVAGLMFEIPKSTLVRDKNSLLAQLCGPEPPILPDPDGFFFFDRDWWLFRYVVQFLRDGSLPDDRNLLAQLYKEATFWNLKELQTSIEENKLHLAPPKPDKIDKTLWWRKQPSWWQAIDEANEKKKKEEEEKKKKQDWWKDTTYKGKVFLPLSTAPDKVTTKAGEKDELKTSISTWESTKFRLEKNPEEDFRLFGSSTYRPLSQSRKSFYDRSPDVDESANVGYYSRRDERTSDNNDRPYYPNYQDRKTRLNEIRELYP